jgi:TonB family protein
MRAFGVTLLLAFSMTSQAEESPILARVIDSNTSRVAVLVVAPKYPKHARRDRIEGEVQVCFDVSRRGRTRRIAVRHSSNRAFERPSIKAVRASTFKPLKKNQPLQPEKLCRRFIFSLVPVEE